MTGELLGLLKKHFGYDAFRPLQEAVIRRIIAKDDALVLMPTGGGKSICYQLPALYMEGTAVVVSPLIALMKDQVEALRSNGIPAAALNSLISESERREVWRKAVSGELKLLYVSPEGVISEMERLLEQMRISLVAIDEAHCISRWGHDFRPEYARMSLFKERFPQVPVVALTATADKITKDDIVEQLRLREPEVFRSSFDRPNLSLTVTRGLTKKDKIQSILRFIHEREGQSGIIYCMKRSDTEMLAEALKNAGISACAYHAGLPAARREQAQEDFINDRTEVVCATIAFGMGIDKSNVRWVIHYNMPGSVENYYQEIGRAGRDGLPSDTLLFYSLGDLVLLRRFAEESGQDSINLEKLTRMQRYCETDVCRRRILLNYFGEESATDCGNCDVCSNPPDRFDGTVLVQKALSAVLRTGERVGMQMLIDILRASRRTDLLEAGYHRLKTYGAGADLPFRVWREYIYQMLQLGYLEIDYADMSVLKVTSLGRKVLFDGEPAVLTRYREPEEIVKSAKKEKAEQREQQKKERQERREQERQRKYASKKIPRTFAESFADEWQADTGLLDSLKALRREIANREQVPAYIVFSDAALTDMARHRPVTPEAFLEVRGVGDFKREKYGDTFTEHIRHWQKNNEK